MSNSTTEIIIYATDPSGVVHKLDAPTDMALSLKDLCKAYDLPMEGMCGGMAMCATCHCYVLSNTDCLPEKSDIEDSLLSDLFNEKPNSRLACQIQLTKKMDGLHIELAPD